MSKLSIFGGTGFVGSNFIRCAPQWGIETGVVPRWSRRPVEGSDTLWLISTTHNYHVFDHPSLDVQTNLVILCEGLESFKNNTPNGVFNFCSSWFVYGNHYDLPAYECAPLYPRGFYSITKKCAEDLVISYCTTFNLKYRIFRLCNVVGPGDKPSAKKNALQYLINKMKNNEEVEVYGDGRFYRNYMHVMDVCDAMRLLIQDPKTADNAYPIFNIGHPEHRHFIDHLNVASFLLGYQRPYKFIEPKSFHKQVQTTSFKLDTRRLVKATGFTPHYGLTEMVAELCV